MCSLGFTSLLLLIGRANPLKALLPRQDAPKKAECCKVLVTPPKINMEPGNDGFQ